MRTYRDVGSLAVAAPQHIRGELVATLTVPNGKNVSVLEWMRTPVTRLSGTGMCEALDRSAYVLGLGTGAVDCGAVAPVKMAELAMFRSRQVVPDQAAGRQTAIRHAAGDGAAPGGRLGR